MFGYNKFFFVVRENEDGEWIDVDTGSGLREKALDTAKKCDQQIPEWAKANPIKRVAEFELTEIKTC